MAYGRVNANWQDFPSEATPLLAPGLNQWDQALYEVKGAAIGALASSAAAGATVLTVTATTLTPGTIVAVGAGTTSCEVRIVQAVGASTITVTKALNIAHASNALIAVCPPAIPLSWYGAQGNGGSGIDAEPALQAACDDWPNHQQPLDGGQMTYYIALPLIQSGEMRLRNTILNAKSNYGPLDNNGAMLQMADVASVPYQTAAAVAATDTFTTTTAHGLTVGAAVLFKGTMPGGVTAGRRYYVLTAPTTTTFTVSLTKTGSTLDITSDGSCRVYRNLQALLRWFLENVNVNALNIAPCGIRAKVQQQSEVRKLRIQDCTYKGATIGGQDGSWWNTEIINCPTLLEISDAEEGNNATEGTSSFQRFYQLNLEGTFTTGLVAYGHNNVIHDLHLEGGTPLCVAVENHAETLIFTGDTLMNIGYAANTLFKRVAGDIIAWNINAVSASVVATILLDDQVNGDVVLLSDMTGGDHTAAIRLLDTCFTPGSGAGENYQYLIRGEHGRYLKYGGRNDASHSVESRASTAQTGRLYRWLDSAGAEAVAVAVDGKLVYKNGPFDWAGSGSPESVVTAPVGSTYRRTNGGAATSFYVKETGTGNTGWVGK